MMDYKIDKKVEKIIKKEEDEERPTLSEKAADVVSHFGGSWRFVIIFFSFCIGWIVINLSFFTFDLYPFILLNLILSCVAVFQAPFILMSQNRLSNIDRNRAENVYKTDLHTRLELHIIHEKIDKIVNQIS